MFLSKLFSIFKKKKDDQSQPTPENKPTASPPGTVGAAVGLSQPNQAATPDSGKVAQGPSEPDVPKADVEAAEGAINPQPTTVPSTPESTGIPTTPEPVSTEQPTAEEPVPTPEPAPSPDDSSEGDNLGGDDSQNISV